MRSLFDPFFFIENYEFEWREFLDETFENLNKFTNDREATIDLIESNLLCFLIKMLVVDS